MTLAGAHALVTGGLGFIGSNLVIRLVEEGARVTVVDSAVTGCGANRYNLAPVAGDVRLIEASIADEDRLRDALRRTDLIFNLAGEISHIHSMLFPQRDLEINTIAQLRFLEACLRHAPGVRILYAGTRQVYGVPEYLPVDEGHPVNPVDFNGVHKYAATMYHTMLSRIGRLDGVSLRLTNVYGPRMALAVPCQGFLATYFRKALTAQPLEVFGDGRQLRDPLYVDDAVEAFCRIAAAPALHSRAYNVGGPEPLSLETIAEATSRIAGLGEPRRREFPPERKAIDIGSYYTDSTLMRDHFGWTPRVHFPDGVARVLGYYEGRLEHYLDPNEPNPRCPLDHEARPVAPAPGRKPA